MPSAPPPSLQIEAPASPLADPTLNESYLPSELKIKPRSPPLVLNENTDISNNVPDVSVNFPKQVYVRKPLPPPRQKELMRKVFDTALTTLSSTLTRNK